MPRDIGNEIVVAIAAIGILAFAFVFAIILSLSNTADTSLTATASHTIAAGTGTEVVVLASSTPTEAAPSATPLRIVSPQSDTVTPSSAAPSITPTRKPSATPTLTWTPTTPPTSTPTATPTLSPTPAAVTESLGILPTPTGTLSPTAALATHPHTCTVTVPSGWVVYVVQRGDTLFSIAQDTGSTVSRLQAENCLGNINSIFAGTPLYVPRLPDKAARNQPPYPNGGQQPRSLAAEGCSNPGAQITNLTPGQTISGVMTLRGAASVDQFWYYKIEVRPDFTTTYNFYSRSETPVAQGVLGSVDTTIFDSGAYWIRLTVLANSSGNIAPCTIPVIINNP